MLTLEEIREKKEAYGFTNEQLAKVSGVPLGTLQKVLGNVTKSPRYETLRALSSVFEKRQVPKVVYLDREPGPDDLVGEPEADYQPVLPSPALAVNWHNYDRQGTYTLEDYLALPNEQRVELIDGVIYDMGAPTAPHQLIGAEIYRLAANYIREKKGLCIPFIAPTDVQLDCDIHTIIQPDVMIVCDRSKVNRSRIFGAPDYVLEVLSPSTRNKDIFLKSLKYMRAGVKEYWMVDPMKKTVTTYDFRDPEDADMKLYTFADKVPMALFDGDLVIDFQEIADYISFIPE